MSKYNQKYSKELLVEIVKESISFAGVLRKLELKQSGGMQSYLTKRIKDLGIDTSHFRGQGSNFGSDHKGGNQKLSSCDVLIINRLGGRREKAYVLRTALIESGVPEQCSVCLLKPEWNGKPITLHIDHIDGNPLNNVKNNLRFICPNCHSQTENFGAKNIHNET